VLVVISFLALDVAVHDDGAVRAHYRAWLQAAGAHCKVGLHVLSRRHLVWHQVLIVFRIRIRTQVHQEPSHILGAAHGREMQRSITFLICYVWFGAILEQQLQDLIRTVVPGGLEQGRSFVLVHLVDIGMSDDEPLTDVFIFLHASQCE